MNFLANNGNTIQELIEIITFHCKKRKKYLKKLFSEYTKCFNEVREEFSINTIDLIGSLAHETHHPESDLDFNLYCPLSFFCTYHTQMNGLPKGHPLTKKLKTVESSDSEDSDSESCGEEGKSDTEDIETELKKMNAFLTRDKTKTGYFHKNEALKDYGKIMFEGIAKKLNFRDVQYQLILQHSILLITCRNTDGLKLDFTVNNNKCARNADFYSMFGKNCSVFRNVARILKLFARTNIGRKSKNEEFLKGNKVYPGGFFFDMLAVQILVNDNKQIIIKSAFQKINIAQIVKILNRNNYTDLKCLKSCVEYICKLNRLTDLVFDYEECEYNYWSFVSHEARERFVSKFHILKQMIKMNSFPLQHFLPEKQKK